MSVDILQGKPFEELTKKIECSALLDIEVNVTFRIVNNWQE